MVLPSTYSHEEQWVKLKISSRKIFIVTEDLIVLSAECVEELLWYLIPLQNWPKMRWQARSTKKIGLLDVLFDIPYNIYPKPKDSS